MSRIRPGRLLLALFLLGFALFFGLDLATRGMERVAGTADTAASTAGVAHQPDARQVKAGAAVNQAAAGKQQTSSRPSASPTPKTQTVTASQTPGIEVKKSFMNQLTNRIGDALHKAARALIGLVVSGFNAVIS
jgi:hypothetical protein